jgi:LPXTG-site transpeptidase (sortase) family protein
MITKQNIIKISGLLFSIGLVILLSQFMDFRAGIPVPIDESETNRFLPKPTRIKIEDLNVDAQIVDLGLNSDGTLEVPQKDNDVGWYVHSPSPGGVGPAVMVGHLDSIRGSAVFHDLKKIQLGDEIVVERSDGSVVTFKVDSIETFSQNNFPSDKVYGSINYAGLRLITCAGSYSRLKGRYPDNLVVFASLEKIATK